MRYAITIALLIVLVTVGCLGDLADDDCKLPPLQDVQAMRAMISFDHEKLLSFSVPPESWGEILDAMVPAVEDKDPLTWQGLGTLVITKKNGDSLVVDLYSLGATSGAYDIRRPGKLMHYRGGQSAKLEKALQAAYQASLER